MEEHDWNRINDKQMQLMYRLLQQYSADLKKLSGEEAFTHMRQVRDMLMEAVHDLKYQSEKRISDADDIINNIIS